MKNTVLNNPNLSERNAATSSIERVMEKLIIMRLETMTSETLQNK